VHHVRIWIASSLSLSSGAHSRDPLAPRNDADGGYVLPPPNQKGGPEARRFGEDFRWCREPGRSEAPPGLEGYFLDFFFDFDFFAFFAFFAFLAIVSSQGLMDGNATRGMLGGGPASQHPQMQSQQIRGALPRTVTWLLLCYPQLLCIFERFSPP
jgi:hypothetical protein